MKNYTIVRKIGAKGCVLDMTGGTLRTVASFHSRYEAVKLQKFLIGREKLIDALESDNGYLG